MVHETFDLIDRIILKLVKGNKKKKNSLTEKEIDLLCRKCKKIYA